MNDTLAKEDAQALVDELIVRAEKLLRKYGEFFPFGACTEVDGEIVWEAATDGTEQPRSQPLIEILRESHRRRAIKGEIRASCIVYDIKTIPPGKTEKQDAIAIEIDHRDNYSVVVVFPYTILDEGCLDVEDPFATSRHNTTFDRKYDGLLTSEWEITSETLSSSRTFEDD